MLGLWGTLRHEVKALESRKAARLCRLFLVSAVQNCIKHYAHHSTFSYDLLFSDDCKYGDRKPEECMHVDQYTCYEPEVERNCCESCGYYEYDEKPYGKLCIVRSFII